MPQKYDVIDYSWTVNQEGGPQSGLGPRDDHQVDLSGRSMKGQSGTPEASHGRVNEAEGDPAPDVVQGATVRLAILL